ncbi:MAG: hypothetical protein ISS69_10180 [Phycisphaerae bacterium]|nr:hypothetical protein [Phycisphaerae bacterium]
MSDHSVKCPSCGREYHVRMDQLGKTAKCGCGERFELIASFSSEDIIEVQEVQEPIATSAQEESVPVLPVCAAPEAPWTPERVSSRLVELGIGEADVPQHFPLILANYLRADQALVDCAFGYYGSDIVKFKWEPGYASCAVAVQETTLHIVQQGNMQKWIGKLLPSGVGGAQGTEVPLEEGLRVAHAGSVLSIHAESIYRVNLRDQDIARRILEAIRKQIGMHDKNVLASELEKLVEMKIKGLLTDQEFTQAKKKLLGS